MLPETPEGLTLIAEAAGSPVYLVGGCVRNALLSLPQSDYDICGAALPARILERLSARFSAGEINKRLGTVVFADREDGNRYEYTAFRREIYAPGGGHTPKQVEFTASVYEDALRRDFRANSVYFDVTAKTFLDPLGGMADIENRVLSANEPKRVFQSDGLRVMRLARLSAELGFTPERETVQAAADSVNLLFDISPERIREELNRILEADLKYGDKSPRDAHVTGLKLLGELGAFRVFLPELASCMGVAQRGDYHRYDVYDHTLETVRAAKPEVRLAALLHDLAKPVMLEKTGKMAGHDAEGERMARVVLRRLRYPNRVTDETARLVGLHMLDLDGKMRESKIRLKLAENFDVAEKLLALKQADYLGSGLKSGECPTAAKWRDILTRMKQDGTPLSEKELALSAAEMTERYFLTGKRLGEARRRLFEDAVRTPDLNADADKLRRHFERAVLPGMRE